jgi:hypothetical protein
MSSKLLKVIILSAVAILLTACAPTPIRDIANAPINVSRANYDLSDVTSAIKSAGIGLGWQMKEETPGHIVGSLYLRSYVAVVDIIYTLDDYSINYKDSTNLRYDASSNAIHSSYNRWIRNLAKQIDLRLIAF